jgi:hypothetical protein
MKSDFLVQEKSYCRLLLPLEVVIIVVVAVERGRTGCFLASSTAFKLALRLLTALLRE